MEETLIPQEVQGALGPFIAVVEGLGLRYYIGGSVAAMVWSQPRKTQDADIIVDLPLAQVGALVAALAGEYYIDEYAVEEAVRRHAAFNAIHDGTGLKLDVYVPAATEWTAANFAHAVPTPIGLAASAADTVLQKLWWYRQGDEQSARQWGDIQQVLRSQGAGLDQGYLAEWAARLGVPDLLARALQEAGLG